MKGSITITDTIGILGVIGIVILFMVQIMPTLLQTMVVFFSKASAETVSRQLSNLITVSGAAPYRAEIKYFPAKEALYKISISSRTIEVVPYFKNAYAEKSSSTQPFAVGLNDGDYDNVNSFLIKKDFIGESVYAFEATKE
jgi:hypothetical protein